MTQLDLTVFLSYRRLTPTMNQRHNVPSVSLPLELANNRSQKGIAATEE